MSTQLLKKSLFTKILIFISIANFILTGCPLAAYCSSAYPSDKLKIRAAEERPVVEELQQKLWKEGLKNRIIVRFNEVGKDDVDIVGGKCANLGEMLHIPGIFVPDGIALTTKAYQIHIDNGIVDIDGQKMTLREYINKRLEGLDYNNTVELGKASRDIRNAMEKAKMPEEIEREIVEWYHKLGDNVFVAVRSSATAEDLPDASFAGQQETYLFKRGDQEVLEAVKYCWSSLFTPRAIFYRNENKIDHSVAYLSVAIQMMIDSVTSGVGFGVDVNYGMPRITVNAAYKLGEGVVSGTVTPDVHDYVYDVFTGEPKFFKKTWGSKLKKSVLKKDRSPTDREATEYVSTTEEERVRGRYALTDEQALMVAKAVKAINEHYKKYMDVEWAFDAQGKLWIVQARSETIWNEQEKKWPNTVVNVVSEVKEALVKIAKILVAGRTGAPKAATGKVIIVVESEEGTAEERAIALAEALDQVQKGDILVTKMTTPDMVPAMKRAAAVVTDEGGPNCHAAIVARELRIPCVVGTSNATQVLKNGMIVTVDARRAAVYDGALEIIKSIKTVDIPKLPITKTLIGIINSAPDLAMEIWQFSKYLAYYGYGLFRKEFVDTTEILAHPLAGLAYDRYIDSNFKDEAQRKLIKEKVMDKYGARIKKIIEAEDYLSYAEFYKDKLATALIKVASAQTKGQRVKYRTTDFKTNEYRDQIGALPFEPKENNPMMGYRGIYRMLHKDYVEAFRLEVQAIKKARQIQKNIDIMFPVVRTPKELAEAVAILAEEGLFEDKDKPQIGMMVEVPSDVFQAEEFYSTLAGLAKKYGTKAFMSIGSNDLTQFTLAIGRDNNKMAPFAQATNPAVLKALEIVIKTANRFGVISGLCGQEPSNNPDFAAHLVRAGIVSISAVPDVFDQVVNVVSKEEKNLEGKPFDPNIAGWEIPEKNGNPLRITAVSVAAADIIKGIGTHPQTLLSYSKGKLKDENLKKEIEGNLNGKTVKQYVIDEVYNAIMKQVKATPKGKDIFYITDDLDKVAYESLLGGKEWELFDENPQLGFCGLARVVDRDYQDFFRWQVDAIKKAREDSGRKNIGIRLNLARTLDEVKSTLEIIKNAGLTPGQDGFMVGMEIAGPANVLLINEFIGLGINFLVENNVRFLCYDLALDYHSPYIDYSDEEKEAALTIPRKIWTNAAQKNGIALVEFEGEATVTATPSLPVIKPAPIIFPTLVPGIPLDASNIAKALNVEADEVRAFQAADETLYQASAGKSFSDFVDNLRSSAQAFQKSAKVRVLIVAPEFFKTDGVISALKKVSELSQGYKIALYGVNAERLKLLLGNEAVITADTLDNVMIALKNLGIASENIIFVGSTDDVLTISERDRGIFEIFGSSLRYAAEKEGKISAIIEDNIGTIAIAKALKELANNDEAEKAFGRFYSTAAEQGVISQEAYSATKEVMMSKLEREIFTLPEDIKLTQEKSRETEEARRITAEFMQKV